MVNRIQLGSDIDGEAPGDESGYSVSLSSDGSILAIGARDNDGNGSNSGHVRVYEWRLDGQNDSWQQKGSDINGESPGDESGVSVSLSSDGSILAIGATKNYGNASSSGHVRVYEWRLDGQNDSWQQKGTDINGAVSGDNSGASVSLSSDGSILAIGAYASDGNGSNSGSVRVYEWNGSTWQQKGTRIDGEATGDLSGMSVSLSSDGSILAIGAYNNDGNGSNSGHVRVYEWRLDGQNDSWQQKGTDIDGEAADDRSGISVSLSSDGSILAIGAYGNDGNGSNSGHVRVYEWRLDGQNDSWQQKGTDIDGEAAGDSSGYSVSLSSDGSILAIGARDNDGNGDKSGHVRVYEWNGSTSLWQQKGTDIDGEATGDRSGWSVSLSSDGSILAIGSIKNNGSYGHVRVYSLNGIQPGSGSGGESVDITNEIAILESLVLTNTDITTISDTTISVDDEVIETEIIPSEWKSGKSDIEKRQARHAAIGIFFKKNTSISSFKITPSKLALEGKFTKNYIKVAKSGHTFTLTTDITENTGVYANLDNEGDNATFTADGSSIVITKQADNNYTVSGDETGNYNDGDTANLLGYEFFFGGVGTEGSGGGVPCFTNTCNILTPNGYVNVSKLNLNDTVITSDNRNVRITKILETYSYTLPYLIPANHFKQNLPVIDTYISRNHKYKHYNKWVTPNNKFTQKWNTNKVTYYHIKLENYETDHLIVNGMVMESWDGKLPYENR